MKELSLISPAFARGGRIPVLYTLQGRSINPPVRWTGVPEGTRELAVLCEDPDAPAPKSIVHWLIYGIRASVRGIPEGVAQQESLQHPIRAKQGLNSFLFAGYTGPNPGFWDSAHRYRFRLFALGEETGLEPGSGRKEFFDAIEGKVIMEAELIGTYAKTALQRTKAVAFWTLTLGALGALVFGSRKESLPGSRRAAGTDLDTRAA